MNRSAVLTGLVRLAVAAAAVVLLCLLLGPVAWRLGGHTLAALSGRDRADAINNARQTLLAAAAGGAAVIGLGFTARTYYLSRRGQLTDRYTRAIAQLGSDIKLTERLGGIYALEHLMAESPRDHNTVVEVLAAFLRESTRPDHDDASRTAHSVPRPTTDVQAALTVLGRRPSRPEPNRVNLSQTDLRGANLVGVRLDGADLTGARLHGADLSHAQLRGALLIEARFERATLFEARLHGADLTRAHMQNADLKNANLGQVQLLEADLRNADLWNAHLEGAGLIRTQLQDARLIGAQLRGAVLHETDIRGAALNLANLTAQQARATIRDDRTSLDPNLQGQLDE